MMTTTIGPYQTYLEVETRVSCFDFNLSDFNLCDYFSGDIHNEQEVCKVREDCLPHRGTEMPGQDLAQSMFQVRSLQHDLEYEKLQRIQQNTLLQCSLPHHIIHCCS